MHRVAVIPRRLLAIGALACVAASLPAAFSATASASAARCTTSGLVIWLDTQSNGAAGSFYYSLKLTNLSGHTCTLLGYPGVSGVDLAGHRLGSAARRNAVYAPHVVTLANGRTASVTLRITDVGVYSPSMCGATTAAGLRVYPPGETASKIVPFPFQACSKSGANYLSVEVVR